MAAGKHLCANRASNAICKISPLLIISTRSEYQVSVELHSVEGGEEEKKAGKCLSSALEHSAHGPDGWTVTTCWICNRECVTSFRASVYYINISTVTKAGRILVGYPTPN